MRWLVSIIIGASMAFGGSQWWRAEGWKAEAEVARVTVFGAVTEVQRLTSERDAARRQVTDAIKSRDEARKGASFANRGLVGCIAANEDLSANLRSCRAGVRFN